MRHSIQLKLNAGVYTAEDPIQMCTNTGDKVLRERGVLLGMNIDPWLDENSMANIISFGKITEHYRITYDSEIEDCFFCHTQTKIVEFKRTHEGLHCISLPDEYKDEVKTQNNKTKGHSHVAMVAETHGNYTTAQFAHAKQYRELYHILGVPSMTNYKHILRGNMIKDCQVVEKDIDLAEAIFS